MRRIFKRKKKIDIDQRLRELNLIINIMRDGNTAEDIKQQVLKSSKRSITCKDIQKRKYSVGARYKKIPKASLHDTMFLP
jgi:hypothetical protein